MISILFVLALVVMIYLDVEKYRQTVQTKKELQRLMEDTEKTREQGMILILSYQKCTEAVDALRHEVERVQREMPDYKIPNPPTLQ